MLKKTHFIMLSKGFFPKQKGVIPASTSRSKIPKLYQLVYHSQNFSLTSEVQNFVAAIIGQGTSNKPPE